MNKFRFCHTQQSTSCLQFRGVQRRCVWGRGRAARRIHLPGWHASWRRRSIGKRGSLVVSGVAVWIDRRTSSFCVGVRPAVALRRRTQSDAERTCRAVGPTQFTPPHQTRQNSPVYVVSGVAVSISFKLVDCNPLTPLGPTSIGSGLVVQVLLCSSWQDFDWHSSSRGPSAVAELLVHSVLSVTWRTDHKAMATQATSQFTQSIAVRSRHLVNVHVMRDVYCQNHTKLLYVDNRLAKLQLTNRKSQIVRFFWKNVHYGIWQGRWYFDIKTQKVKCQGQNSSEWLSRYDTIRDAILTCAREPT